MFKKIYEYLGSLRVTICLIVSLGTIFLFGLWIPQKAVLDYTLYRQWQGRFPGMVAFFDFLGLTDIYTSPITLVFWLLFFANLAVVIWRRLPVVFRKITATPPGGDDPVTVSGFPTKRTLPLPAGTHPEGIVTFFSSSGYRVTGAAGRYYGVKNRLSPLASLLFHLSFFLMLLGGVVSIYTRFGGMVDLATGETFHGEMDRYNQTPYQAKFGTPPHLGIEILDIVPLVEGTMPTSLTVRVRDDAGAVSAIDINRPYTRGHTVLVIKDLGVAPLFIMRDAAGREIEGAFHKLNVLKGKEDGFRLAGQEFHARFFPDYAEQHGRPVTLTEEFRNPAFRLALVQNGVPGEERTIRPGETLEMNGRRLQFAEMRYWVRFAVIREYGLELLYAGFAVATIGLILRLIFYRREFLASVRMTETGPVLDFAGRSEFYRELAADEFDALLARLTSNVSREHL